MKILKKFTHIPVVVACADHYRLALSRKSSCVDRTDNKIPNSSVMPFFDDGLSYGFHPAVINPAVNWIKLRLSLRNLFAHNPDVAREAVF